MGDILQERCNAKGLVMVRHVKRGAAGSIGPEEAMIWVVIIEVQDI